MNKSCESILRYTLTALLSGSCQEFNTYIKSIKGVVDSGFGPHTNITFEQLVVCARKKYLNMKAQNEYNKVDPQSAQLIALTTEVTKLNSELESKSAALTTTITLITPILMSCRIPAAANNTQSREHCVV